MVFAADWDSRLSVPFPSSWTIPKAFSKSGATVDLAWDSRLFDVRQFAFAEEQNYLRTLLPQSAGVNTLTFKVPAGVERLLFASTVPNLYPAENLGEPQSTSLRATNGTTTVFAPLVPISEPASPWGVVLTATWTEVDGFAVPLLVGVTSVGPNPVPPSTQLVLRYANQVADKVSLTKSSRVTPKSTSVSADTQEFIYTLDMPLPAEQTILIDTAIASRDPSQPSLGKLGQVFVRASVEESTNMRSTQKTFVAPVTSSGTHVSDYSRSVQEGN